MSKKNWNNPEIMTLELEKTLSPSGNKTCGYQNNVEMCPYYEKRDQSFLPLDDPTLYNKCKYSWGNDCKYEGVTVS